MRSKQPSKQLHVYPAGTGKWELLDPAKVRRGRTFRSLEQARIQLRKELTLPGDFIILYDGEGIPVRKIELPSTAVGKRAKDPPPPPTEIELTSRRKRRKG